MGDCAVAAVGASAGKRVNTGPGGKRRPGLSACEDRGREDGVRSPRGLQGDLQGVRLPGHPHRADTLPCSAGSYVSPFAADCKTKPEQPPFLVVGCLQGW